MRLPDAQKHKCFYVGYKASNLFKWSDNNDNFINFPLHFEHQLDGLFQNRIV